MWQPEMADLVRHFEVLRYDTRGHGASQSPSGEYSGMSEPPEKSRAGVAETAYPFAVTHDNQGVWNESR
jgi:hypothetical protein